LTFVYYVSLQEWAADADQALPVYTVLADAPAGEVAHGAIHLRRNALTVAQVRPPVVALYHVRLGRVEQWNGQQLSEVDQARLERDRTLWRLVAEWLRDQGFALRRGLVAPWGGMLPLDGDLPEFVGYDKESDRFYRMG
jgi:hypothetical protein